MKATPIHARRSARAAVALAGTVAIGIVGAVVPTSAQAAPAPVIELKVLVLDDGEPMVGALRTQLEREGVPYVRVDLNDPQRPTLSDSFLSAAERTANFQAVVAPNHAPQQLSEAERTALSTFEASFGIRQVSAYNWPNPDVGQDYPVYSGAIDGLEATLSPAADAAGFGYLTGTIAMDDFDPAVTEGYGYVAKPIGAAYEPFLTVTMPDGATGSLMGVHSDGGREELVLNFAQNGYQQHAAELSHGIVEWMTRGVHLGAYRNYLSVHVDDVFLPNAAWSTEGNCTVGADCDPVAYPREAAGSTTRMTVADAKFLKDWQAKNDVVLDLAYNGFGVEDAQDRTGAPDALFTAMKADSGAYRWLNHTWSHQFLSCERNETVSPWACVIGANGQPVYVPLKTVTSEISRNVAFGTANKLALDATELITGEHSGLAAGNQMRTDNPAMDTALKQTGVKWIGSDASREKDQRAVGTALTVPRYPMSIFYNASTVQQEADEYNWIYSSRASGGSGICEDNPATTTCIAPIDVNTGFQQVIVPHEVRMTLRHMTTNDPRPHYVHQGNLADDRVLYPVLDGALDEYHATYDVKSTPIVNPTTAEAGKALLAQTTWAADMAGTTATLQGSTITLTASGGKQVAVPVSVLGVGAPSLTGSYAGASVGTVTIKAGTSSKIALGTTPYPAYRSPVGNQPADVPGANAPQPVPDGGMVVVPLPELDAEAVPMAPAPVVEE